MDPEVSEVSEVSEELPEKETCSICARSVDEFKILDCAPTNLLPVFRETFRSAWKYSQDCRKPIEEILIQKGEPIPFDKTFDTVALPTPNDLAIDSLIDQYKWEVERYKVEMEKYKEDEEQYQGYLERLKILAGRGFDITKFSTVPQRFPESENIKSLPINSITILQRFLKELKSRVEILRLSTVESLTGRRMS